MFSDAPKKIGKLLLDLKNGVITQEYKRVTDEVKYYLESYGINKFNNLLPNEE